ncbi:hypothetical protein M2375_000101 [Comamonas sp. BIGb0152]|uniref:DoxX-like family protein n=1 Tax=Comamonas sp. BIGb0152 TaxID=2940601 RepID=UPI002168979B|nr:DoxX-like family protein [Comamonas sp. BIGb0152]MCS4291906.1 hypothetical protein [Comamonas sp. BIGb0152]
MTTPSAPRTPPLHQPLQLLRLSLVAVWLWTASASLLQWQGESTALLQAGGIDAPSTQAWLIAGGAALDLLLGLWLLCRPGRNAYATALVAMLVMTVAATALLPALWLHPLGPLSKNLPIAAALWLLWQSDTRAMESR